MHSNARLPFSMCVCERDVRSLPLTCTRYEDKRRSPENAGIEVRTVESLNLDVEVKITGIVESEAKLTHWFTDVKPVEATFTM